jgi:hypothetical protein
MNNNNQNNNQNNDQNNNPEQINNQDLINDKKNQLEQLFKDKEELEEKRRKVNDEHSKAGDNNEHDLEEALGKILEEDDSVLHDVKKAIADIIN